MPGDCCSHWLGIASRILLKWQHLISLKEMLPLYLLSQHRGEAEKNGIKIVIIIDTLQLHISTPPKALHIMFYPKLHILISPLSLTLLLFTFTHTTQAASLSLLPRYRLTVFSSCPSLLQTDLLRK